MYVFDIFDRNGQNDHQLTGFLKVNDVAHLL